MAVTCLTVSRGTGAVSITVSQPGLLVATFVIFNNTVTSVTGGSLTWTQRSTNHTLNPAPLEASVWTAYASTALGSITVTPNQSGSTEVDLFIGVSSSSQVHAVGTWVDATSTSVTGTITPGATTDYLIGIGCQGSNTTNWTAGTGYTLTATGTGQAISTELENAACGTTSSTSLSITSSASSFWSMLPLAINSGATITNFRPAQFCNVVLPSNPTTSDGTCDLLDSIGDTYADISWQ
jgi:hypothetical protein